MNRVPSLPLTLAVAALAGAVFGLWLAGGAPDGAILLAAPAQTRPAVVARPLAAAPVAAFQPSAETESPVEWGNNGEDFELAEEVTLSAPAQPTPLAGLWAVAGLFSAATLAAAALWRRRPGDRAAAPLVPVDLEAGAPAYRSALLREAGRPSLALGAKKGIHPEMYEAPVYCGGELVMTTNGTKKEYVVDIWSGNHPFYQNKGGVVVSDAGRLERFKNKYGKLGGLGSFGEVPTGTGPTVALKLEPKAKKKPGKK